MHVNQTRRKERKEKKKKEKTFNESSMIRAKQIGVDSLLTAPLIMQ